MEAGDGEAAKTRAGADCSTDHELLISNIRGKLKKGTKIFVVPNCNVNSILNGFKDSIKNRFALVNLIDWEAALWTEIRNIIWEECEKTMPEAKRQEKLRWIIEEH